MARYEEAVLHLTPAMRERLTELSATYRVSRSLIVREVLEAYLTAWEEAHYERVADHDGWLRDE